MTDENIDAYAAGLVDGEGCIYIAKNGGRYQLRLQIAMSRKAEQVLLWMQFHYGGRLHRVRHKSEKWEQELIWKMSGAEAARALKRMSPHLLLKQRQCVIGLRCEEIREALTPAGMKQAKWTDEAKEQCEILKVAMQSLNLRGPQKARLDVDMVWPMAIPFVHLVGDRWCTFQRSLLSDTGWEQFSGRWPNSGMGAHGEFWMHNSSEWPKDAAVCSLSDVLVTGDVPPKYFLSPTACRGILRRAEKRGRALPPALQAALQQGAESIDPEGDGRTM